MLFVISPAKTLDFETPGRALATSLPDYLDQSAGLIEILRTKTPADLSSLMAISDNLAVLNAGRYQAWSREFTPANSRPAVLAFMGDVYEGLDARSLSDDDLSHANQHLRILSGLYGLLRPLDLMQPYRLEMGTRLANPAGTNLYAWWGDTVTEALNAQIAAMPDPVLVNLASDEYFKAVRAKQLKARVVECVFEDGKAGHYKIISFYAKRARGLMARYAIQHRLRKVEDLARFDLEGYRYTPEVSSDQRLVFRREAPTAGRPLRS
ncbi:peroxide stress protein YaaA [Chitinimonas sp. BJYL2]|uniref:peroxide stress protein YaaA n=1 Tax=Chitinimonas sp. BJYL2 TaxID=2976696 RepID=UPI0022B48601|nr:peroxide stress protein YaaA [Chitinimonas sp. BJYL2]